LAPVFFIVTSVLMLALAFFERPSESFVAIATLRLGIPPYFLVIRRKKKQKIRPISF
jgi:hypothetical protein